MSAARAGSRGDRLHGPALGRRFSAAALELTTCASFAALLAGCAVSRRASSPLMDPTATATVREADGLEKFHDAIARYVTLRDGVVRGAPEASSAWLAAEIRRKRGGAKQGDVLRRDIEALFRRSLAEELRDPLSHDTRRILGEGNPQTAHGLEQDGDIAPRSVALVANRPYPARCSFSSMPPRLLQRLPALPSSIDYRFVGRKLVLVDTVASLVIDYLPDALPIGR
jgi:hypothetical protein